MRMWKGYRDEVVVHYTFSSSPLVMILGHVLPPFRTSMRLLPPIPTPALAWTALMRAPIKALLLSVPVPL